MECRILPGVVELIALSQKSILYERDTIRDMRFLSFGDRPTLQTAISFLYVTSVYRTFTTEKYAIFETLSQSFYPAFDIPTRSGGGWGVVLKS